MTTINFEEYSYQEVEKTDKIIKSKDKLDFVDLFPELKLIQPYASLDVAPFWVLLPYYETLIFDLYPFQNEKILEDVHGVNVNQLMKLHEEGKIQFALAGKPSDYQNCKYLYPILETSPPSHILRISYYIANKFGHDVFFQWEEEAKKLFLGKLPKLKEMIGLKTDQATYEGSIMGAWLFLKAKGYDDILNLFSEIYKENIYVASLYLDAFQDLLCAPSMISLGGLHSISLSHYASLQILLSRMGVQEKDESIIGGFSPEIGKFLNEKYNLVKPESFQSSIKYYSDYKEARQVYFALMNYVKNNELDKIENQSKIASKAFDEVTKLYKRIKNVQTGVQVTGVIGAAASGLMGNLPGLFASLGFGMIGTNLIEGPIELVSKLGIPSEIVTLFEFDKKMKS
jgi:hypothetical protein